MPEYLAPGVFVEEVSFRSKSIEGVPTSTTGFAGLTQYGPVYYADANSTDPLSCEPRLITSFTEFERVYGGLEPLQPVGGDERIPYLAHAARAFFENGGRRLYVARVFAADGNDSGIASRAVSVDATHNATWWARWPGAAGNVKVEVKPVRGKNVTYEHTIQNGYADDRGVQAKSLKAGAVVEINSTAGSDSDAPKLGEMAVLYVDNDGVQSFRNKTGSVVAVSASDEICLLEMRVTVHLNNGGVEEARELAASPLQKRNITRILQRDDPEDENAPVWLQWSPPALDPASPESYFMPALLMHQLITNNSPRLQDGNDGVMVSADDLYGAAADPDVPTIKATGLCALAEVDDIAIVALPDSGDMGGTTASRVAAQKLVTHAEQCRYRIAVVDGPVGSSMNEIRDYRSQFDSKYAALYYPWIKIFDPTERFSQGTPPRQLLLPPSGFVAGIYARSDIERGVHKAPANEVVRGLTRFEVNVNKPRQETINPEGINALRFFEGRGHRVWGARTMSSDPEWKYVNVRRLFCYIEHSIDKSTQWAVFEPNNRFLWDNIRRTVEDFLLVLWRDGALMGAKPEDAFFVRCDRTTMTQNDLDNGRMICLVGVAPTKPAEFVVFRIGQWTGDAKA